jgi:hypothetical protein
MISDVDGSDLVCEAKLDAFSTLDGQLKSADVATVQIDLEERSDLVAAAQPATLGESARKGSFDNPGFASGTPGSPSIPDGQGLIPGRSTDVPKNDDEMMQRDNEDDDVGGISNVNQPGVAEDDGCLNMRVQLGVEEKSYQREHKAAM